ncbi:MAG: carbohydrate kinase [Pseudomonadota bacterium]
MKAVTDETRILSSQSPRRRAATIALFGEVLADEFPDRHVLGGAPFNVARHLRAFGLNPVLITRTGNDALREELLDTMRASDMETMGVQCDSTHPTGRVQVHLDGDNHRFEILPDQAYDHIHATLARMVALSVRPELVYFGTLAQRRAASRSALRMLLNGTRAATFFDVNLRPPWYEAQVLRRSLRRADTVKLNQDEMETLAHLFALPGDTWQGHAHSFMQSFDIRRVLVTCGAQGACLLEREGGETRLQPSPLTQAVVDTVGAGDAFSAVFILGQLARWPLATTLERAHAFAAAICTVRGAVPDQPDFYEPFLAGWRA